MVSELYAVMAMVSLLVIFILLNYMRKSKTELRIITSVKKLLFIFALFCSIDAFWGFMASHTIFLGGKTGFIVISAMFHLGAVFMSFYCCRYTCMYLDRVKNKTVKLALHIPMLTGLVLITANFFIDNIFIIDENLIYHSGSSRSVLFMLEYVYFMISALISIISVLKENVKTDRYDEYTMLMFNVFQLIFGMLQFQYPDAPFYSCGCMLSVIVLFCGSITMEKENKLRKDNEYLKVESQEVYKVLQRITESFVSVHLFDLTLNRQHSVKSTPYIDVFINSEDGADEQIRKVMGGVTDPEYTSSMQLFVDLNTLNERMKDKKMISREFLGKNQGWCISSFLRMDSAPDEDLKKVIHVVQSIDEVKRREKEYENALRSAYEDQNFIYTEMLKMQAGGVIATDTHEHIITMNDVAARLFNYESADVAPKLFNEILDRMEIENYDEAFANYQSLRDDGKDDEYYFSTVTADGKKAYVLANAKRIILSNGTRIIITSFTDITKNREKEELLLQMSETDALTGIRNRGSGEKKTEILLETGKDGLFCLLDVNKFKLINDTFGHSVGDKVLVAIASALKDSFRERDVVMRLGGDEFAVFAPGIITEDAAKRSIGRFFEAVSSIKNEEMGDYEINVSLGAVFSSDIEKKEFDVVYRKADSIMYKCKNLKGNNYAFSEAGEN